MKKDDCSISYCVDKCTYDNSCTLQGNGMPYKKWTDCSSAPKGCSYWINPPKCGC